MTWAETKRRTLNWLSLPGAPKLFLFIPIVLSFPSIGFLSTHKLTVFHFNKAEKPNQLTKQTLSCQNPPLLAPHSSYFLCGFFFSFQSYISQYGRGLKHQIIFQGIWQKTTVSAFLLLLTPQETATFHSCNNIYSLKIHFHNSKS